MLKKKQKTNTSKKPSFKRRPMLIIGLILLMAVVALATAKILASVSQNNANNEPESTEATSQESINAETASSELEDPNDKTPRQYEGTDPNTLDHLTGVITYAGVLDSDLSVSVTIDQYLGSGTCELTLTNNNKTVSRTADIIANPSSATCDGFRVPLNELGSGTWTINLKLTSGDKNGTITGEVNL